MKNNAFVFLFLFFMSYTFCNAEVVRLFDMGTKNSPLWQGFLQVTPETIYNKETRYGWENNRYIRGINNSLPDALYCDGISGQGKFLVDLPNGKYGIYLVMRNFSDIPKKPYGVKANGKIVIEEPIDSNFYFIEYYRYLNFPYRTDGPGLWEKLGVIPFESFTYNFETEVTEGQLSLEFYGDSTVNMCIIHPAEWAENLKKEILRLNEARAKTFYSTYHKNIKIEETKTEWKPSKSDKQKGYVIFTRNPIKKVYPYSLPQPEEINNTLDTFAAKGEYVPVTFSVYPLKDLKNCTITIPELKDSKGNILKDISIHRVEYLEWISGYAYSVEPRMLVECSSIDIPMGFTTRYWITIKVPAETPEGIYNGKITFKEEQSSSVITLNVRVLPFILEEQKDMAFGMFCWANIPDLYFTDREKIFWDLIENQIKDMREHGATIIGCGPHCFAPHNVLTQDKSIKVNFAKPTEYPVFNTSFEKYMDLQKVYGYKYFYYSFGIYPNYILTERTGFPPFSEKFNEAYKEIARQVRDKFIEKEWPELVIMVMDEPREFENPDVDPWWPFGRTKAKCIKLTNLLKEVPGIKTSITLGDDSLIELVRILDIPNPHGWERASGFIKETIESGKTLWIYNNGLNRYSFGLYTWKRGAKGNMQWEYLNSFESPGNLYGGWQTPVLPKPGGYLATPDWELVRQGIDDYKYIKQLENRLLQAKTTGVESNIIDESEKLIKEIKEINESSLSSTGKLDPWGTDFTAVFMEECPADFFDKYRWRIASQIMSLDDAIEKRKIQ